jgi:hypothetical protein
MRRRTRPAGRPGDPNQRQSGGQPAHGRPADAAGLYLTRYLATTRLLAAVSAQLQADVAELMLSGPRGAHHTTLVTARTGLRAGGEADSSPWRWRSRQGKAVTVTAAGLTAGTVVPEAGSYARCSAVTQQRSAARAIDHEEHDHREDDSDRPTGARNPARKPSRGLIRPD